MSAAVVAGALVTRSPLLGLTAVAIAGLAILVLRSPDVATLAVVALVYSNAGIIAYKFHGVPLQAAAAIPLALVVPFALHLARGRPAIVTGTFLMLLAFLVVQIVSALASDDSYVTTEKLKVFLLEGVVVYFLVTNVVRSRELLRRLVWTLVVLGGVFGALSLIQELTGSYANPFGGFAQVTETQLDREQPRVAGPIGDKNYYAQVLLILVPLGFVLIRTAGRRLARMLAGAATALVVVGIALTLSRGAFVTLAALVLAMLWLRLIRPRQIVPIAIVAAVVVAAVPAYHARIATLGHVTQSVAAGETAQTDKAVQGRTSEMLAAALVFTDHPVIGVGPGLFPSYYRTYAEQRGMRVHNEERFAHNLYLQMGAELGMAGLVVFLAIVGLVLRGLLRGRSRIGRSDPQLAAMATGFVLAIGSWLVSGMFLSLAYERYFWLLIALAASAAVIMRSAPAPPTSPPGAEPRAA